MGVAGGGEWVARSAAGSWGSCEGHQDLVGVDGCAGGDVDLGDGAIGGGGDAVLHLHRLEDHEGLTFGDLIAL